VTAALIGFIIGPRLIAKLRKLKFGQSYDDNRIGELAKFDKKNTPTMGGLLIFAAVFFSSFLWAMPKIWVVVALFVFTALTAVGFRDDWLKVVHKNSKGISSREKIGWQTLVTIIALAALLWHPASTEKIRELWVPFVKYPVLVFSGLPGCRRCLCLFTSGSSASATRSTSPTVSMASRSAARFR
jgi:phospho-N-acetylmuramoyl-pentapeptide-transferase